MKHVDNIFTVDLEEWFVAEILSKRYTRSDWKTLHSSVERNCLSLLKLLEQYNVKATWFVLGWVAEANPGLIWEIFSRGHEIGCHSFYHRRIDVLDRKSFREDTEKAINSIYRAIGNRPFGYRAPSWSLNQSTSWALEILADLGFSYDSSVFPIKHDIYGWADGPREKIQLEFPGNKKIYEIPASTYRLFGKNIPIGGGGYFRHSPYWYSKKIINSMNKKGKPVIFYIHPWELDSDLPQLEGLSAIQRFRTYSSTSLLVHKLDRLLRDFHFSTFIDYLNLFKKNRIGF